MQATRQRILDFLSSRGSASSLQLAKAFGMSAQNVRRHLHILEQDGRVTALEKQPGERRGRPQERYALTPESQGDNLAGLSSALLAGTGPAGLRRLARRMAGEAPKTAAGGQRLVAAVRQLEPQGYRPHWEARPDGPQVVLGHCPFAAIIEKHPELCRMDGLMLQELLGAPTEQVSKLQPGPQGTPQCIFRISK